MLPKHFHPHDKRWIGEQLQMLNPQLRGSTCQKYSDVYQKEFNVSKSTISPEGDARFKANTRLRVFVGRIAGASQGVVKRPPKR
jgi:hypothetical protein